jgi:small subunit ribosomal protein S8
MVTDPIANMLNMAKNAGGRSHETVAVPYSKLKHAIAECLEKEGYVKSVAKKTKLGHPVLEITLAYINEKPRINDVARVSKPSKRVYMSVKDIRPVKNGHGILVLSTPKGILTDKQAKKEMVGGEALFKLW